MTDLQLLQIVLIFCGLFLFFVGVLKWFELTIKDKFDYEREYKDDNKDK